MVASVCPYCGVGCGQLVYVKDEKIIDIEGDPRSPNRKPHGTTWETIPLDQAMAMVAERVKKTRDKTFETRRGRFS